MTYRYGDLEEYNWLMAEILRHETPQALHLGELLTARLHPKSVIDVGCGPGVYLLSFKAAGAEVYGIDGASGAGGSLQPAEFELVDLRNPWVPARRYDLALCIEVAEHLQPEHAGTLLTTLVACSDVIYFSAARVGQGGEGHYNEQDQSWWLREFGSHGYGLHPLNPDVQGVIGEDPVYEHCHWLRWNGMLLKKEGI